MNKPNDSLIDKDLEALPELLVSPSETFHECSKLLLSDTLLYANIGVVNTSEAIREIITSEQSHYDRYPEIKLPVDILIGDERLDRIFRGRRSIREFGGNPITLKVLSMLLASGGGIVHRQIEKDGTEWHLRAAPSPGGLYAVELFCFVFDVADLAPGLYFYNSRAHSVELLVEGSFRESIAKATVLDRTIQTASLCIVMAANMGRIRFKYGERAYRFVLLESGHICQNMLLAAYSANLGALAIGGYVDDIINELLGLDGCEQAALYLLAVGTRKTDNGSSSSLAIPT